MKTFSHVTRRAEIIDTITCNKCGQVFWERDNNDKDKEYAVDYLEVSKNWGYYSPWDLEQHNFDLCISCYKELINSFKKPCRILNVI